MFDGDETLVYNNSKLSLITEDQMLPLKLDFGTVRAGTALYLEWLAKINCAAMVWGDRRCKIESFCSLWAALSALFWGRGEHQVARKGDLTRNGH